MSVGGRQHEVHRDLTGTKTSAETRKPTARQVKSARQIHGCRGHNATRCEHDPKGNVTAVISPLGARDGDSLRRY
ncbi:MAG: hypothetical protein FWD84_04600 [Oscillospiraceae bacterium]|nr:hypothetical protein [Oscillospiraceae bacterium]